MEELLVRIANGTAAGDLQAGQVGTPMFVVAGACPNRFCPMQAVLFCQVAQGLDFWWIKPQVADPDQLEPQTLTLHHEGPHKNVAESSRAVYGNLVETFRGHRDDSFTFGVDESSKRAFIEEALPDGQRTRMLLVLAWQEDWSGFFSLRMYMNGKICYQKVPASGAASETCGGPFYVRPFEVQAGRLLVASSAEGKEREVSSPLSEFLV